MSKEKKNESINEEKDKKQENKNEVEVNNANVDEVNVSEKEKDEYIAKLNNDLLDQKKKADEYFENLKRNMAEFDNFKKRITKEKDNMYNLVSAEVLSGLLPILDNFENAINSECSDEAFKNGMNMIYTQFKEALEKIGLEEIKCIEETFDPNFHEAVMHIEDDNYAEKEIVEVLRKGYKIGDKVIRHSMVKVAN